jgi:hypothetical protein
MKNQHIILILLLSVLCIAGCKLFQDETQPSKEEFQALTQEEAKELIHECHYKLHSHLNAFDDCEWCIEENWVVPPSENKD